MRTADSSWMSRSFPRRSAHPWPAYLNIGECIQVSRLILIRHGETDWNVDGRWQGQADVPLNARGIAQAEETAQSLSNVKFAAIYSSDLARARQTAEALSRIVGLPVQTDARLREIHQGAWQGLRVPEIEAQYAEAF